MRASDVLKGTVYEILAGTLTVRLRIWQMIPEMSHRELFLCVGEVREQMDIAI